MPIDDVVDTIVEHARDVDVSDGDVSEVTSFLAGNGPVSRAFYTVVRALVAGVHPALTRLSIEGREHLPGRVRSCSPRSTARTSTRRSRRA